MSVCVLCGSPWGPVFSVWAPCGALPSGGLPPFGVPPPVLTDSLRARRAALRTAHAQRLGILATKYLEKKPRRLFRFYPRVLLLLFSGEPEINPTIVKTQAVRIKRIRGYEDC